MCGIVGYVGSQESVPILLEGLRRLEYRGYDSAGVAILNGDGLKVEKAAGKIAVLERLIHDAHPTGFVGIAHTRWATHGEPNTVNAHPHVDCKGRIAVVHNGIIENYSTLKTKLEQEGHEFRTDTDTEVLVHLIEKFYDGNLEKAVAAAVRLLTGHVRHRRHLERRARRRSSARGTGARWSWGSAIGEYILASDVSAIIRHTNQVVYLDDEEMVVLTPAGIHTTTIREETVSKKVETVDWDLEQIEKAGFPHFMLKEIFEQPQSLRNTLRGRLLPDEGTARLGGLNMSAAELRAINRIIITACGTSWHAGLIGEYLIEELARIPVEVEYASEFRYRNPDPGAGHGGARDQPVRRDGRHAGRDARGEAEGRPGARHLQRGRLDDRPRIGRRRLHPRRPRDRRRLHQGVHAPGRGARPPHALPGPPARALHRSSAWSWSHELEALPGKIETILAGDESIRAIARAIRAPQQLPLPRPRRATSRSRSRARSSSRRSPTSTPKGYPAAEMKHGPIALIDENMPVVFICTHDSAYEKVLSNMEEVRARRGKIIAVATEGDTHVATKADHVLFIPHTLGPAHAAPLGDSAPAAGLPHRGGARLRRGPAAQSRQERDGRVTPHVGGSVVHSDAAPAAIGPYVQGRTGNLSGRWIATSGQIGLDPATGDLVPGGIVGRDRARPRQPRGHPQVRRARRSPTW